MKSKNIGWIKRACLLSILSTFATFAFSQSRLSIQITNLRSDEGFVILELLDEQQQIVKKVNEVIRDSTCTIVFDNLKNAKYAVRFIHDENSNGELDTNWFGMPKEGYGFSNNAFGFFGPKDFEEWLFELKGNQGIVFVTKY